MTRNVHARFHETGNWCRLSFIIYEQIIVWEQEKLNKEMDVKIYFVSDAIYFYPEEVGKYEGDIDIQPEDIIEVCYNNRY